MKRRQLTWEWSNHCCLLIFVGELDWRYQEGQSRWLCRPFVRWRRFHRRSQGSTLWCRWSIDCRARVGRYLASGCIQWSMGELGRFLHRIVCFGGIHCIFDKEQIVGVETEGCVKESREQQGGSNIDNLSFFDFLDPWNWIKLNWFVNKNRNRVFISSSVLPTRPSTSLKVDIMIIT